MSALFWFVIGAVFGCAAGVIVVSLCVMSGRSEDGRPD